MSLLVVPFFKIFVQVRLQASPNKGRFWNQGKSSGKWQEILTIRYMMVFLLLSDQLYYSPAGRERFDFGDVGHLHDYLCLLLESPSF